MFTTQRLGCYIQQPFRHFFFLNMQLPTNVAIFWISISMHKMYFTHVVKCEQSPASFQSRTGTSAKLLPCLKQQCVASVLCFHQELKQGVVNNARNFQRLISPHSMRTCQIIYKGIYNSCIRSCCFFSFYITVDRYSTVSHFWVSAVLNSFRSFFHVSHICVREVLNKGYRSDVQCFQFILCSTHNVF